MDKQNPYILIVDADPNMIRAVSESFGAKGFDLISAQTGSEALIQIGKRHADVALIDVQRGDMTGLDLLREIKSLSSETECIFLTGNTAQSSAIKAVQAGIFGFFQKPFDLEQILLSIQHAVEKKQSAQALQESERLAHAALDALSSHIAVLDESGKIIAVNRAWRIFAAANLQRGLELNSFVGENYLSVCETSSGPSSEGTAEMAAGIRSVAMGKQEQFSLEYPCHSPNERRWFNAHVSRFSGAGSLRIIVSHENITERILAEETLRDREASLQTILQSTADGILAVNNEGKILYANERFVRMWRIPKTVMDGGDDAALIEYILGQLIDSQSFLQKVQELYKSDEESFDTLYFKDGRIFERLSRPMLQETKPRGRVWSFRDITERKLADALTLRQSEHLQLLYDASQRLNRTLDLDEIYQAICDFMSVIAPNDGLVVSSFDPESQLITCRAYWMGNKWLNVGSFPTIPLEEEGKGAQSIAIRTGRSMLVNDYQTLVKTAQTSYYVNDETNQMDKEIPPEDEEIPRSALIVPLKTGEMVSGVIQVLSYQLNAYTEDQLKLLEALALHIASAEENALLYAQVQAELDERKQAEEEMRQRMIELELLYDSGLAFSQLLSPKDIGSKIIELLEQKMDWHHTAIRLYDPKTNAIQLLAFNQRRLIGTDEITRMEELLRGSVIRLDRGLSGWVVQHGQIVRSDDLAHDERYFETLPGMKSGLYVPIKLGGRVIGVITIESEKPNAFSEADERLTSTLANQAASVLENARLFDETQRHIRELTALHRTSQTLLAAHLDPEQIYAAVHQAVAQTMPCEAFMIVLDDANRGEYHAVYFFDKGERFPARWLPRNAGISGRVISSGQTLLINDVLAENVQATYFGSMELTRSILAVPLRRGAEIVGMMSTQSYQPNAFGEPQRALLETITAHLSSTLDNAHLYLQTQARINELETLHVISTSLRTLQTVDEALSTILDNTLATLETDAGSIMLYDPPSKELRDVVARGWFTNLDKIPIKAGEGVAGTVFVSGELHYTVEFVRDTLLHAATRARVPSGWGGVCLPIRTSTEIIGVMFISVQLPRQITPQQIRLLESLVDMAGAALHRMSLHNETARRAEEFAVLYETSKALSAEYDLNSLLGVIVNGARNMLNAAASGMYLYHAESKELELVMDTVPTIPIGSRLLLGEGVAGKVAQSRQPLRIEDYLTWEGRSLKFGSLPIRAVIEVPMLYAGELIGVLTADEIGDSSRKFTDADERLLSLFASQAAGAINAARHREETIHYAEELERRVIERTAEIEATRHRLDLAASAGGIGVWEVNLKDNTVFWDTQMHIIHGTGKMDFDNSVESWWKMLHPEDVARTQKQFENALQNNGMFMDEYRILLPDASMRYIAANAIVLYDAEHNPERVIGVNMDITERKKSEEILYHANMEMERALRTKDEFLATMSHELRTPLNSILGISESLEEQFVGTLNEKQLKYTGIIRESGRHLLELINDILDISKIEAGRMELEIQNLSVEKVCQSSLRMIRELAQRKNLNVSFEIKGNVKTLLGDERRLKQSLVNLLGNAVKFTPQGGAIGLEVEGYAARNEVTFTVWDKGVGIADEDIQHLFKPFVQLDSGLAREYQGTGLGLALVSQMIRLHGGRVHVESILGQGSRFIITMPWMKDQQNTQVAGTGELSARRLRPVMRQSGKILLVEDTNVVVTLMTEYLHFKGYKVLIARNGVEGVQLAKQEHPDLILMDVMMPVMDGLEATRQIRADASLRNIPIIALTALAMTGDRERCLAAGMNDYLSKPIKMQKLADMIEKYLGAGRPVVQPE